MKLLKLMGIVVVLSLSGLARANYTANSASAADAFIEAAPAPKSAELKLMIEQLGNNITNVEDAIARGDYGNALSMAQDNLNLIKVQTGVDPKVTVEQPVIVERGTLVGVNLGVSLSQIDFNRQVAIKYAVKNHIGGWYLDLINLAKRNYVHWVAAQYMRVKASGHFFEADKEKFRTDLARAYNYSIYVKDPSVEYPLMISDKEVVSTDQEYYFDREIMVIATQLPELSLNEASFVDLVNTTWNERLQAHHLAVHATPVVAAAPAVKRVVCYCDFWEDALSAWHWKVKGLNEIWGEGCTTKAEAEARCTAVMRKYVECM